MIWVQIIRRITLAVDTLSAVRSRTMRTSQNVEAVFFAVPETFRKNTCNSSWIICKYYETNLLFIIEIRSVQDDGGTGIYTYIPSNAAVFFSDEAFFLFQQKNIRHWSPLNPHKLHERIIRSHKVIVWYAISQTALLALTSSSPFPGTATLTGCDHFLNPPNDRADL